MADIKKVIILGGGTAGMMAASLLSKVFGNKLDITLIESKNIGTIGVGESSTASLVSFIKYLGLDESEWMDECSATYKVGGKFVNWSNSGDHFVLVEDENRHLITKDCNLHQYLVSEHKSNFHSIEDIHLSTTIAKNNLSPKFSKDVWYTSYNNDLSSAYGYNFDAKKFADMLRNKVVIPNGVKIVTGDVKQVTLDEYGFVSKIKMLDGWKGSADLYIDCSGFKSVLIEQMLDEPFLSFSDSLFCDRALALPIPYKNKKEEMVPYTTITTMNSGWSWKTPIFDRIGSGYVYSSKFISDEEAEKEFRNFIGYHDGEVLKLKMRVGTRDRVAVKNVVACGLAGGFAEPMESTGISTFQGILTTLVSELERTKLDYTIENINNINSDNIEMMIDIRDFIISHYILCNRNDTPFWQSVHKDTFIPDTLDQKLKILSFAPPPELFRGRIFGSVNWFQWLWSMGMYTRTPFKLENQYLDLCKIKMDTIKFESELLSQKLPNNYEYLKEFYGRE